MNILAIGAHFDDLELGCSGTLMNHVENDDTVYMLVVTDSGYRNARGVPVRSKEVALQEGKAAADLIGAELILLNYETFLVPNDEGLTRRLLECIENFRIDTIYSHWIHDVHRDHEYSGKCALMAGRHVPRFLMYRSNYYGSDREFRGNFYLDISLVMERKIQVVNTHKSELERVRHRWIDFVRNQCANDGMRVGVQYAECFEVVRYLR